MLFRSWLQELGSGDVVKTSHPIQKVVCSIGTDALSDVRLQGRGVASVHAWLRTNNKGIAIESVGGERVSVNGRRTESHVLQPGDLVDVGQVRLRFHVGQRSTDRLPGAGGKAALELAVAGFRARGMATPHDAVVAGHLADVREVVR